MSPRALPGVLVVAKAPIPGLAKTRIARAAGVGDQVAADLAAAALLDTLSAVEDWAPASRRLVALVGDLAAARRGAELAARFRSWHVVGQRGASFAERLVNAHHDAAGLWGAARMVVQVGMDTPQLTPADLEALSGGLHTPGTMGADAVLGPATDGGWWGLATRRAGYVDGLRGVAMSTPWTREHTSAALRAAGARVLLAHELSDVDVLADATAVAAHAPGTRFARALAGVRIEVTA